MKTSDRLRKLIFKLISTVVIAGGFALFMWLLEPELFRRGWIVIGVIIIGSLVVGIVQSRKIDDDDSDDFLPPLPPV